MIAVLLGLGGIVNSTGRGRRLGVVGGRPTCHIASAAPSRGRRPVRVMVATVIGGSLVAIAAPVSRVVPILIQSRVAAVSSLEEQGLRDEVLVDFSQVFLFVARRLRGKGATVKGVVL